MKLAIVAVVVVLLLGGGGAVLFFQGDSLFSKSDETEDKSDTVSSYLRGPIHFELKPFAVPIIRDSRVDRYVLLQVKLELVDEDARTEANRLSAKLHDAFISSLYDYYSYVMPGTEGVNLPVIRKRLMRESERTLGKGQIRDLTVKGAVQQRK